MKFLLVAIVMVYRMNIKVTYSSLLSTIYGICTKTTILPEGKGRCQQCQSAAGGDWNEANSEDSVLTFPW
jgi:hypothetical protein